MLGFAMVLCGGGCQRAAPTDAVSPAAKGHFHVQLLKSPLVRAELGIGAAARAELEEILEKSSAEMLAALKRGKDGKIPVEGMRAGMGVMKERERQVLALLTPAQKARLAELSLQDGGPSEMEKPDIAAALKLTADQVARLNRADKEHLRAMFESLPTEDRPSPNQLEHESRERQKSMEQSAREILTPEQWAAWERMLGQPLVGNK